MFLPDKRQVIVFIVPMLSLVGILLAVAIVINTTDQTVPTVPQPNQTAHLECTKEEDYCTYTHENKEYLVYNGPYKKEYDLQFFNLNIPYQRGDFGSAYDIIQKSITDKFIIANYAEYQDFCKNNNLKQKYTDNNKKYLIYYYNTKITDDLSTKEDDYPYNINADLGALTIKDQKATLFIWDIAETYTGANRQIYADESVAKTVAYSIIVPTDEEVDSHEIKPLMYRTDYNEMLNRNPMSGYSFTYDDNKQLASKLYINSKNKELNTIINNSIDALSSQHTVEIANPYYLEDEKQEITETRTFDFISSIQKEQSHHQKIHYVAYTPKLTVHYDRQKYGKKDITTITHSKANDRSEIFKDFLDSAGISYVTSLNDHRISIDKTSESFIIKANPTKKDEESDLKHISLYIDNRNFLIQKAVYSYSDEEVIYSFNYSQEVITMPDGIYEETMQPAFAKPIIYLYPTKTTNVTVKLGHPELLSTSYPKYNNGWTVRAEPSGKLIDKKTGRELYSLYWEGNNSNAKVEKDGFIIKGKDTAKFLEEKLAKLGLTAREAEEFIIYWLPKMEKNKYNYIRFQTSEQINSYMPLNVSPKPDTVIRVFMAFKPLQYKINVTEQKLPTAERKGFTVVEWGGTEL